MVSGCAAQIWAGHRCRLQASAHEGQFVLKCLGTNCASTELSTEFLSIYTFHISSLSIFSACELHRSGLYPGAPIGEYRPKNTCDPSRPCFSFSYRLRRKTMKFRDVSSSTFGNGHNAGVPSATTAIEPCRATKPGPLSPISQADPLREITQELSLPDRMRKNLRPTNSSRYRPTSFPVELTRS